VWIVSTHRNAESIRTRTNITIGNEQKNKNHLHAIRSIDRFIVLLLWSLLRLSLLRLSLLLWLILIVLHGHRLRLSDGDRWHMTGRLWVRIIAPIHLLRILFFESFQFVVGVNLLEKQPE
jgi:hypothetical protein